VSNNNSSSSDVQTSITSLWEDLKQLTKEVVAAMNLADDLRSKTGGLQYRIADLDEIVISNQSAPTMDVTISLRSPAIHVHTRTVIEGVNTAERESWESFTIQNDKRGTPLREGASLLSREGEELTVEQAVYHILRPFLHRQAIAH